MEEGGHVRSAGPAANTPLLPSRSEITNVQVAILIIAIFLKGGLLGAYIPYSSLWLSEKGYDMRQLGLISLVDAICSLFLPLIGGILDKLRSHNSGFSLLLVVISILKLSYIPAANSFVAILILAALTSPLLRGANSILDALALYAFQDKGNFSKVRLFGDVGFGCIGLGVGIMYTLTGNIDIVFWIFAGICLTLAVMWFLVSKHMESIRPDTKPMTTTEFFEQVHCLRTSVLNANVARALFCLWLFGGSLGIISTFEFVLLKRLMGNGILLGSCKLVGTIAALPVWWFLPSMTRAIGTLNVQIIGLCFASLRLYILGVITNPWYALISEFCSGIGGFAIAYGPITIFAGRVTNEDMKGTAQTVIFVIFTGLGAGGSTLVAGYFAYEHGLQNMFLAAAAIIAIAAIVLLARDFVSKFLTGSYQSLEESCNIPF